MAEVSGERQHVTPRIGAGIEVLDGPDGEGVPQGVGRGPACRAGLTDSRLFREFEEHC